MRKCKLRRAEPNAHPASIHGAFLTASVECASLIASGSGGAHSAALRLGAVLEGHVRSWSNVLERLHHSSAFYVLLSPSRLLSPPAYMPAAGLLAAGPLLRACAAAARGCGGVPPPSPLDWAHAALVAAAVYAATLPPMLPLLPLSVWAAQQLPSWLLGDARRLRDGPWLPLLALVQLVSAAWLLRSMVACCAAALPVGLLLSPACLGCRPGRGLSALLLGWGSWLGYILPLRNESDALLRQLLLACALPSLILLALVTLARPLAKQRAD